MNLRLSQNVKAGAFAACCIAGAAAGIWLTSQRPKPLSDRAKILMSFNSGKMPLEMTKLDEASATFVTNKINIIPKIRKEYQEETKKVLQQENAGMGTVIYKYLNIGQDYIENAFASDDFFISAYYLHYDKSASFAASGIVIDPVERYRGLRNLPDVPLADANCIRMEFNEDGKFIKCNTSPKILQHWAKSENPTKRIIYKNLFEMSKTVPAAFTP